jgi:hypothetical protein
MEHPHSTFFCGVAPFSDLIFFAKGIDEPPHSSFQFIDGSKGYKTFKITSETAPWTCTGLASASSSEMVAIGSAGQCWEISPKTSEVKNAQIENLEFELTALSAIAGKYYAAGMGRTVYLREAPGKWRNISPQTKLPSDKILGFEDIDGFSADDIYTIGWAGEVWNYTGVAWDQIETGSKQNFNAVCCAEDGNIYGVGDNGAILRRRDEKWQVIMTGVAGDLQDVRDFDGKIYIVSDHQMFQLQDDRLIVESAFSEAEPSTFLHLLKAKDGLVSIGPRNLWTLQKGVWNKIV